MAKKKVDPKTELEALNKENRGIVVTNIINKINELDSEISTRNAYMNTRDRILYEEDYLVRDLGIKPGFDATEYNFLPRASEIHKSQVMGRGFNLVTIYDKEDISFLDKNDPEYAIIERESMLKNKRRAIEASNAKKGIVDTIEDNGGFAIFSDMAGVASSYGTGIIKKWYDTEEKRCRIVNIESTQNFRAGWRSTNFRIRDFDAIVYDISLDFANKTWKNELKKMGKESFSSEHDSTLKDSTEVDTSREMVTVVDFVGSIPGINDGEPFHALVIGDNLVGYETNEMFFPKYYIFPNKIKIRRPWGLSDISDRAISMNKSYIEAMSDSKTLLNKMFPFLEAKGFDEINLPQKQGGEIQVFPIGLDQSLDIKQFQPGTYPYLQLVDEIKQGLFRELGLGRVLIDDPSVSFESNQALMTGMKSTIDIAEDKQNRWKPILVELFEDILHDLKTHNKEFAKTVGEEEIRIDIEWPSILRKEDASYRTMLFNDLTRGIMSIESYMEKTGVQDPSEELDRIKSEMKDDVEGAILSGTLNTMKQMEMQQKAMMEQQAMAIQQQGTGAPLTTDQNQTEAQPASQPGSGAPAVSPEGNISTQQQNQGL